MWRGSLDRSFRSSLVLILIGLLTQLSPAQTAPKVTLDSNEALFTALAAMNTCGYDAELSASDPLRADSC